MAPTDKLKSYVKLVSVAVASINRHQGLLVQEGRSSSNKESSRAATHGGLAEHAQPTAGSMKLRVEWHVQIWLSVNTLTIV